jgi:dihydroorotate dehydrogenase electron transfer subunit
MDSLDSKPSTRGTSVVPRIHTATVAGNRSVCREHFRLSLRLDRFADAKPGQFVHLSPWIDDDTAPSRVERSIDDWPRPSAAWSARVSSPMIRRAFSVASLARDGDGVVVDVIHRVVGKATRWLAGLMPGDRVSVMGPLGNEFPIHRAKSRAWMVAGGVGLPPMLYLARALHAAGKRATALCGAQSADLFPLSLRDAPIPDATAREARPVSREFAASGTGVVLSTDDGSLGFAGHVGDALRAHLDAQGGPSIADDLVVYACGPERMLEFVGSLCVASDIECHLCMERSMACGTGTCQSCVVPVRDETDDQGWRYQLCCTDGPIFDARAVLFHNPEKGDILLFGC